MIWLIIIGVSLTGMEFYHLATTDYSMRQNEHRRKLGAVYMTLNNPFYEVIDEEIRTTVENHGDVLISRDPALNVDKQVEEVQDLIALGVELIFINPVDWTKVEPALELARAAKIPVIAIDTNVDDDSLVACTVVSDNYSAGVQCAEHLLKNSAGGKIVLLKHSQARSSLDRMQGFIDKIAANENFEVIAEAECLGQLEVAMPVMERLIREHPEINIVMALNDPSAMGALAALQSLDLLGDIKVYGVDGAPETKEMIFSGRMTATVGQFPRQIGQVAADRAYRIISGDPVEKIVTLPTKLISSENISAYELNTWE